MTKSQAEQKLKDKKELYEITREAYMNSLSNGGVSQWETTDGQNSRKVVMASSTTLRKAMEKYEKDIDDLENFICGGSSKIIRVGAAN